MAEQLIDLIQEKLREETWTRATISNFTSTNLKELSDFVEQAKQQHLKNEVIDACYEHLDRTKDSISALYMAGMLSLDDINDTSLETLADILLKNHKEQILSAICSDILESKPNNKFALRSLAEIKKAENDESYWDLYKALVKIDFDECDIVKALAEHEEQAGRIEEAKDFYKKALLRYVKAKNYTAIKEVWTVLAKLMPQETHFFQLVRHKVSKNSGEEKAAYLMQILYDNFKPLCEEDPKKWDTAIAILKQNLAVDPKDFTSRKEIIECYKGKYGNPADEKVQKHVEDYIARFMPSYRDIFECINDFEKHIAFDKDKFVLHQTWGIGKIRKIENDVLFVNFGKRFGVREISIKMAVSALKPLSNDHIWVKKATTSAADYPAFKQSLKDDVEGTLKMIITSFDNSCDFKRIKAELVSENEAASILKPSEWTSWNSKAKKILQENPAFGVDPDNINCYVVRTTELLPEEKLSNEFKAQKQFFDRADILMRYFNNEFDTTSDLFDEMYSYFTANLKNIQMVNQQVVASYLLKSNLMSKCSSSDASRFDCPCSESFETIYKGIENPKEMYDSLKDTKDTEFKAEFIRCVRKLPDWQNEYIRLFPVVLDETMINTLVEEGYTEDVQKLVRDAFKNFRDYRETAIFFFKNCQEKEWFQNAGVSYEKQLITLINLIELGYREINSHVNSTENKKIIKNICTILFDNRILVDYLDGQDENTAKKMYTLVSDLKDLDPTKANNLLNWIKEKFPGFEVQTAERKTITASIKGMLATKAKLDEKIAQIEKLQNVLIPENAKDIAVAREQGDLKENAEYKAAREKQHMLQLELSRLEAEKARAIVFDPSLLTTSVVSFATIVTLTNNTSGQDETYTILGPWESDPDQGIVSYLSPFGSALMDKKVGESAAFTINEHSYNYTVKEIKAAKM